MHANTHQNKDDNLINSTEHIEALPYTQEKTSSIENEELDCGLENGKPTLTENQIDASAVSDKDLPYTSYVVESVKESGTKRINLSLENMISASHLLSIVSNSRKLELNSYNSAVKNYVTKVIDSGNITETLNELNRQIVVKTAMSK